MEDIDEMLAKLAMQVERLHLDDVMSPVEDKLANALLVLIRIVAHERAKRS